MLEFIKKFSLEEGWGSLTIYLEVIDFIATSKSDFN